MTKKFIQKRLENTEAKKQSFFVWGSRIRRVPSASDVRNSSSTLPIRTRVASVTTPDDCCSPPFPFFFPMSLFFFFFFPSSTTRVTMGEERDGARERIRLRGCLLRRWSYSLLRSREGSYGPSASPPLSCRFPIPDIGIQKPRFGATRARASKRPLFPSPIWLGFLFLPNRARTREAGPVEPSLVPRSSRRSGSVSKSGF